jgi:hypothetical protein
MSRLIVFATCCKNLQHVGGGRNMPRGALPIDPTGGSVESKEKGHGNVPFACRSRHPGGRIGAT